MTEVDGVHVEIREDAEVLAQSVADALAHRIARAQDHHGVASIVLTGGGIGTSVLGRLAMIAGVDWGRVDLWWGDERFLPAGDADRNATQAAEALLDRVPLDAERVHPMPPDRGQGLDAAAAAYAAELARAAGPDRPAGLPRFDVCLLGVGPEGHVASLFPGSPGLGTDRTVVAVSDSPKPPPLRISLSLGAIRAADEVWWIAAGTAKAPAIAAALGPGAATDRLPVAGARGRLGTIAWLDREAAAGISSR